MVSIAPKSKSRQFLLMTLKLTDLRFLSLIPLIPGIVKELLIFQLLEILCKQLSTLELILFLLLVFIEMSFNFHPDVYMQPYPYGVEVF